jgi:hypothetical protein
MSVVRRVGKAKRAPPSARDSWHHVEDGWWARRKDAFAHGTHWWSSLERGMKSLRKSWSPGTRKAFRPYAIKLGELVFVWNELHHNLSVLFELVVQSPSRKMGMAIWHSTDSDFAQRKMLRAATERASQLTTSQRDDILWALNRIDESLRHDRNDALHSPFAFLSDVPDMTGLLTVPHPSSDSPRAKSLRAKGLTNLKARFKEHVALATALSDFTAKIGQTILAPAVETWPDRPSLPHAHQKKSRKGSSRQNNTK